MEKLTEVTPEQSASSPTLLHDRRAEQDALDFRPYTETLLDIIRDPQTTGPLVMGLSRLLNLDSCQGDGQWVRVYGNAENGKYLFSIILSAHASKQSVSPKLEGCDDRGPAPSSPACAWWRSN